MAVRRVLGCFVMASLVLAGAGGSPAHAKNLDAGRVAVESYNGPVIGTQSGPYYACSSEHRLGCVNFTWRRGERTVSFEIQDTSGLPVYAQVGQWVLSEDTRYIRDRDMVSFCGKTTRPFRIDPKKGDLTIFIWDAEGPVPDCPGAGSAGDVVATFTK